MNGHLFGYTVAIGAAAVLLAGCGDLSDFPADSAATGHPAASPKAVTSPLDMATPDPTPTLDPQIAQLQAIVTRDTTTLNADLDELSQCED